MADASQNNPKKEIGFALIGVLAFLAIVLLIGVSAFLRPAGEHIETESNTEDVVVEEQEVVAEVPAEDVAVVEADAVAEADTDTVAEDVVEEPAQSAEEAIAATTDESEVAATVAGEADTVESADVVIADDMSVGSEEPAAQ